MDSINIPKSLNLNVFDYINSNIEFLKSSRVILSEKPILIGKIKFQHFKNKESNKDAFDAILNLNDNLNGSGKVIIGSSDDKHVIDSYYCNDLIKSLNQRIFSYRIDPLKYSGFLKNPKQEWKIYFIQTPFYCLDEIKDLYKSAISKFQKKVFESDVEDDLENNSYSKKITFEFKGYDFELRIDSPRFKFHMPGDLIAKELDEFVSIFLIVKLNKSISKETDSNSPWYPKNIDTYFKSISADLSSVNNKMRFGDEYSDTISTRFDFDIYNSIAKHSKSYLNDDKFFPFEKRFLDVVSKLEKFFNHVRKEYLPKKNTLNSLITFNEINKEVLLSIMDRVISNEYSMKYSIIHVGDINYNTSSNENYAYLASNSGDHFKFLYFNLDKDQTHLFSKSLMMKINSLQFFRENKFCNFNLGRLEKNGVSLYNFSESKDEISHDFTKNLSEFYNSKTSIFSFKILDTDKNFILDSDYKKNFSLNEITPYYEGKSLIVKNKSIHDYETTIVENSSIKIEKANSNEIKLSEEKIKDVKKILRGVYLKALFNISESVGVIHFNELKLLCIDEIEWIVRNENPDFDDSQISKIMAYVNSVKDKSIVTTIRKCITGVGESIWDRIKDKKLMKVYNLFKVVNGEKTPKKMLLASYNFKEDSSEKHHNRFQTVNDFEALGLTNKKIYYKNVYSNEIFTALVIGKGKVNFENKPMSLSEANRILISREREMFLKEFPNRENLDFPPYLEEGNFSHSPVLVWYTEESCRGEFMLYRLVKKKYGFQRRDMHYSLDKRFK